MKNNVNKANKINNNITLLMTIITLLMTSIMA